MIKRLSVILVLSLFVVFIFAGGAFGTTAKGKSTRVSTAVPAVSDAAAPALSKYAPQGGVGYKSDCYSIVPEAGQVVEHWQVGDTWYDFQKNGSMGRMISVSSGGYRHISWMYTNGVYPGVPRYVKGNCEVPANMNNWISSGTAVDGGTTNAGYSNQTHLSDGTSLVIYHRTAGTPIWYAAITADDEPCGGFFTRHWDIPDYFTPASPSGTPGEWPKCEVQHDTTTGRDYIHVVMSEGNTAAGAIQQLAYERCYIKDSTGLTDPMYCQAYAAGATHTYRMLPGVAGGGSFSTISAFDSSCSITVIPVVSKISKRVAVVYMKPAKYASCDYGSDVAYIESMNLGEDWINGTNWPAPHTNLTNYGTGSGDRAFNDLSACYDFQDSLHIVWAATSFDSASPGTYTPSDARMYHWSKKSGISIVAQQHQPYSTNIAGAHNQWIAKMSISASDPIYHPSGDSVYLWATWTQFDTTDIAADGLGNGDLWGTGSNDGGATWGGKYDLTNTHTPGCAAGACLSEHWSSMAQNMWNGDLHLEYVCDQDAGGAIQDASTWMDNPMMYLRLHEWPLQIIPGISVKIVSPSVWYGPPMKIAPSGTRTLIYKVFSIGNGPLVFSVLSDNSCITANVGATSLAPRDSATLSATVSGVGACNNKFINGNIVISSNDPLNTSVSYPVQAVVSNNYYECPTDPATNDTLKNGVFNFYVNANSQEWIHDTSFVADTTHDVFFQGGPFIATKIAGDTLVGRYYGANDEHTLAQVDLKQNSMYNDFWLEYSWNVSIHNLNPPMDSKWWWFDMLHEDVFFKPTANDDLKHTVIKFITVERHDPPGWWPSQPTFTSYEDTYIGMMMDMDCPWDTMGSQNGRNRAGYDATNNIAWQRGWDYTGAHPLYNNYYAGIALAQGKQPGESTVPWGTYNLRNDIYLYPQSPWGWKDGDFYRLAAGNTLGAVQEPDSIVDRSQILTARKIAAGNTATLKASFTVIEAVGTTPGIGPTQLAQRVTAARNWVTATNFILCGDANNSGAVEVGDIVTLINYLYKGAAATTISGPFNRADCNSSGAVEVGDIVTLINYLYKGAPASTVKCPGIW